MTNLNLKKDLPPERPIVFWDRENPLSVINLVPDPLRLQIDHLSKSVHAELLTLTETDLYRALQRLNQQPNPTDNRLRIKFWIEYDRCHDSGDGKMIVTNITGRVCSRELFYKHYITNPPRLAWMLCPPASWQARAEEALNFGVDQLRLLLDLPEDKVTKFSLAASNLRLKIVQGLDDLVHGTRRSMAPKNRKSLYVEEDEADMVTGAGSGELSSESAPQMTEAQAKEALAALTNKHSKAPGVT